MNTQRFFPVTEVTFPFYVHPQKADEMYERRRLAGFITRRQRLAAQAAFTRLFRGIPTVDPDTIRPFMQERNEAQRYADSWLGVAPSRIPDSARDMYRSLGGVPHRPALEISQEEAASLNTFYSGVEA